MSRFPFLLSLVLLLVLVPVLSVAQKPELIVEMGHSDEVIAIAFSLDGRNLATGGFDSVIKLWDVKTRRELRTLYGHSGSVLSLTFSPDGKSLASGGQDGTIRLWNVISGEEVMNLKPPPDPEAPSNSPISSLAFSRDGKMLASASVKTTIKVWDIERGKVLRTLGSALGAYSVSFSPDGETIAVADKDVVLWNVKNGSKAKTFDWGEGFAHSVIFLPDGKRLIGCGHTGIVIWNVSTGEVLSRFARLSGDERFTSISEVAMSPDGRMLSILDVSGAIRLESTESGKSLGLLHKGGSSGKLEGLLASENSMAFSPDGTTLVAGGYQGSPPRPIRFWDIETRKELQPLYPVTPNGVHAMAVSTNGKLLVTVDTLGAIKLWDLNGETRSRTLDGSESGRPVPSADGKARSGKVVLSPDVKTLAYGNGIWNVDSGERRRTIPRSVAGTLSPDGRFVVMIDVGDFTIWNVETGELHKTLEEISFQKLRELPYATSIEPAGKLLAGGSRDGTVRLWDLETGKEIKIASQHSGMVGCVAFDPQGKLLASAGYQEVRIYDVDAGREVKAFQHSSPRGVQSVVFSPDSAVLASVDLDSTVKLWDVDTGKLLRTFHGRHYPWYVSNSAAFTPDGKTLISTTGGNSVKFWDVNSGRELAQLTSFGASEWAVATPDGLFDGSPAAWKQLRWRFDNNTFNIAPVEAYFNDFYYPGLLQEIMQGKRPVPPAGKDLSRTDRRRPTAKIALADPPAQPGDPLTTRTVTVRVDVADNMDKPPDTSKPVRSGAQDVRLFRNDSLVKVWRGDVLQGRESVTLEASVAIVAGANEFTAYAFNHDNVKSEDATIVVTGADSLKRKGTAHILAVGVNKYANRQYNLKYAVADAQDFGEELKRQQDELQTYERVEVVALLDKDATKEKILQALSDLQVRTQPQDAVVVYFAGHGTAHRNQFYLIPHDLGYQGERDRLDEAGLKTILSRSISDRELEQAFEMVDAGRILLVIDACNSGQALEAEEKRRGPMNSKGLAQLAYEKGMYILTAAQSYQEALGSGKLGHGYLTYALVEEGLKSVAADTEPKDGQILLREWLNYATNRVPLMQEERIKQEIRLLVQGNAAKAEEVQRPRVFYRRELETQTLIVARTATIQQRNQKPLTVP